MKATHNKASEPDKAEWKFPCLGATKDGTVVIFMRKSYGTCIIQGPNSVAIVGEWAKDWSMELFKPLPSTESVTLQND
jgi:hypothetical protein